MTHPHPHAHAAHSARHPLTGARPCRLHAMVGPGHASPKTGLFNQGNAERAVPVRQCQPLRSDAAGGAGGI
jgi:hypothetical protein